MNNEWYRIAPISFYLTPPNERAAADKLKEFYLDGKKLTNDKPSAEGLGKLYNDAIIGFGVHRSVWQLFTSNFFVVHKSFCIWFWGY